MKRTRIKFCGVMRVEDAHLAVEAGADAVGVVLYQGAKRHVSLERAAEVLAALPPFVTPVGLFVDEDPRVILDTAGRLGLRHVQLNGVETPDDVRALSRLCVVKAIQVVDERLGESLRPWREAMAGGLSNLRGIVLETAGTGHAGGSGVPNDWGAVRRQQEAGAFAGLPPLIAAGGLTPETVGQVVRSIRPWAVDVSSGVEATFGCKSAEKMRAFTAAVRAADLADAIP